MDRVNETYVLYLIVKDVCQKSGLDISYEMHLTANTMYEFVFNIHNSGYCKQRKIYLPIGIIDTMSPIKFKELLISELY